MQAKITEEQSYLIVIIFAVLLGFFLFHDGNYQTMKARAMEKFIDYATLGGSTLKVELAITPEEQATGLSSREGLADGTGMLFIFDHADDYAFWMKDMYFPIDIIWIGENYKVVYIKKYAQPEAYLETYVPDHDAKYVLEAASGFSDKNNLKVGDSVQFSY